MPCLTLSQGTILVNAPMGHISGNGQKNLFACIDWRTVMAIGATFQFLNMHATPNAGGISPLLLDNHC